MFLNNDAFSVFVWRLTFVFEVYFLGIKQFTDDSGLYKKREAGLSCLAITSAQFPSWWNFSLWFTMVCLQTQLDVYLLLSRLRSRPDDEGIALVALGTKDSWDARGHRETLEYLNDEFCGYQSLLHGQKFFNAHLNQDITIIVVFDAVIGDLPARTRDCGCTWHPSLFRHCSDCDTLTTTIVATTTGAQAFQERDPVSFADIMRQLPKEGDDDADQHQILLKSTHGMSHRSPIVDYPLSQLPLYVS